MNLNCAEYSRHDVRIHSQCVATSENALILCCDICFPANTIICYFNATEHILEQRRNGYNAIQKPQKPNLEPQQMYEIILWQS